MSSVPPSSGAGRSLHQSRLGQAKLRFPRALFSSNERPPSTSETTLARERGRVPPSEELMTLMLEGLELEGNERVLELGSSTTYPAALLSAMAAEVFTVTPSEEQAHERQRELVVLGCQNATAVHADALRGWPAAAPYQAIIVAAGLTSVAPELLDQLAMGGRLVAPIGEAGAQLVVRFHKRVAAVDSETLGACHVAMLNGPRRADSPFPWTRPA